MIGIVFCLSLGLISVASNPVTQIASTQQCSSCQQNPDNHNSLTTTWQQPEYQNEPNSQPIMVQNATPNQNVGFGDINQLLMNKIMSNQCLQRILNPNTKLINQNGLEVPRQSNSNPVSPNVVNNYFILPPEVFLPNEPTVDNTKRKKRPKSRKTVQAETKAFVNTEGTSRKRKEPISGPRNSVRSKKVDQNRGRNKKDKTNIQFTEINNENSQRSKKTKKRRPYSSNKSEDDEGHQTESIIADDLIDDEPENSNDNYNKKKNRSQRRKSKQTPKVQDAQSEEIVEIQKDSQDTVKIKTKKGSKAAKALEGKDSDSSYESDSYLKNIESPLDNLEVTKDLTENKQKVRNPKTEKPGEFMNTFNPVPDNMFNNFYPYNMPFNNYFPTNINYPFDFTQFYQPFYGNNNRKGRKRTNKKKPAKKEDEDTLPNVIEIKIKPRKRPVTTESPIEIEKNDEELKEDIKDELDTTTKEIMTPENDEQATEVPAVEILPSVSSYQESEEEIEDPEIPSPEPSDTELTDMAELVELSSNLQIPPNELIEDLYEYITPELGREDIVPTIYNGGIINDYYPIFNDDAYYSSDENYQLNNLENARLFYSTDIGQEESYSRDRRKYDTYDYKLPNNIKDRINLRRGFINKDRIHNNELKEKYIQKPTSELVEKEILKPKNNDEINFQMPPLLENPDFRSVKINKESAKSDYYDAPYYQPEANDVPQLYARITNDEETTNLEKENNYVETVFAKTKVVKYGGPEKPEENPPQDKNKFLSDDHTTYVVAKSLGPVEDFYW